MSNTVNSSADGKRNIMLIGSRALGADEIRKSLGVVSGHENVAWYGAGYGTSQEFLRVNDIRVDIILLDLCGLNADYPKECFLQLKAGTPDIPIIVLTDRTDYDLIAFVMDAGAADNVSQWQLRSDPERLSNVIESCIARARISKLAALTCDARHDEASALEEENISLRAVNLKVVTDLKSANDKADAGLVDAHVRGAAAVALRNANDDRTRLQQGNDRLVAELRVSRDKGISDLKDAYSKYEENMSEAHKQSDAVLKYAQEKGAIDLKKAKDENLSLIQYNTHAREWLSGSYTQSSDTNPPAIEQDDSEKLLS